MIFNGYKICFATKKYQRRKHRKNRINKKWQKRYGFAEYDYMPHGEIMQLDGVLWMTESTYKELRKAIAADDKEN